MPQARGFALAMAKRRKSWGVHLARHLAGLGIRRERRGKRTPEEARARDRPWGGQSCPDLAQGQSSTNNVSLKTQAKSRSEWDLQDGSHGSWLWKRRHSSGGPAQPLGRLQRPAVGSASDMANYASMDLESPALAADPDGARCPSCPVPAPGHLEQGTPDCLCLQPPYMAPDVPLNPEPPGNVKNMMPRPASFLKAEGTKGKPATPEPALPEAAQILPERPSARRTRYHITVILQGRGQTPGEEGEEPKPAQQALHPFCPEEFRGWQNPLQGPRPITGCPTDPPQESRLKASRHQKSSAQQQELQAPWTPGSPHRRELGQSEPSTLQDGLLEPNMEEAGRSPARTEARVVSARLTWQQRPPAQQESKHRFHKVSLVSEAHKEAPQEGMFEYSHRGKEVNGFTVGGEETVNHQGPQIGADSKSFQSHGPIFSKKYTPPPREKRLVRRLKEVVDQGDGNSQDPRTEPPRLGAIARTELLVPLPGPREPSPHPGISLEKRQVTRTVRTTVVVGGHVDQRVRSSVTLEPVLPRGRSAVRAVVVSRRAEGLPSHSQALELLNSIVPAEQNPPASRLSRPMAPVPRSPGLSSTVDTALGQLPETEKTEPKDRSAPDPVGIPEGAHPPQNQEVPAAHPDQDQVRAWDTRAHEVPRVQEASNPPTQFSLHTSQEPKDRSAPDPVGIPEGAHPPQNQEVPAAHPDQDQVRAWDTRAHEVPRVQEASNPPTQLSLHTSQGHAPVPSSPRLQTHTSSLVLDHALEQPVVPSHPRVQLILDPKEPQALPSVKKEGVTGSPAATIMPMVRSEAATVPGQPLSSARRKCIPSPGNLSVPSSPTNKVVQDSENASIFPITQKETVQVPDTPADTVSTHKGVVQGPGAPATSSPKQTEVVQDPEGRPSTPQNVIQGIESSLGPSLTKEESVQDLIAPAIPSSHEVGVVQGSDRSPISSPTQMGAVQGPAVPPAPSSSVGKVPPSPAGPSAPEPMGTGASPESQLVPDSTEDKVFLESLREEEEVALDADLEIFLDTLRSMESPEILRTHRLPRAPRSSYLAMFATLPAIEEDQPRPGMLGLSPQEVPALEEKEEKEEEEEEPENPYLSDDEKLQRRREKAWDFWDSGPSRPHQTSYSPLEMMKKHVTDAKRSHSEPGSEWQTGTRPTSRLGGSLFFGGLVPASKEVLTLGSLGTKLSALPPHGAPGLKKVPGQLPLLCSERLPTEKPEGAGPPEGWSSASKTQGKLNTRPGKVILFSEPGCQGSSRQVWEDIADTSGWAKVASIRVLRGCWVLYEEPEFQGQKLVLPEGDVELRAWGTTWSLKSIGSLRRVVRDYITPEISLYSEKGLKGEQVKLTKSLEDPQSLKRPMQVASASVPAGLWLLYPKPLFEGTPCILEPGEYLTSDAWSTSDPSVGSLKPIKLGCPRVEKPGEPKAVVYEAPGFQGQSWEVSRDIYNLQQPEDSHSPHLASVGSLRVLGGCWVGYEKEGFRGHQYLLEEGEYPDWSHWGGYDKALTSLRVIRTDFSDPAVVLFEAMDFEGPHVEVSEALPDVELAGHRTHTQAIHVLSGVWVAYQEVGFSGEQYVLEKGVYRNCDDWGAGNSALASLQPVLQVEEHNLHFVSKIQLFSGPDFLGDHISFEDDQASLPPSFQPQSCLVQGGSWILFDEKNFEGDQHILSEGEFPTLTAMGCLASTVLGSLQKVPLHFSEPSIFLYGLECFEGKEIELSGEVRSLQAEGFSNHVLSVRIQGGTWVLCEHSDFRGRQWLVGSCEITNWLTYSGTQRVGSLYPIKQRRAYFRLWNAALGGFLAVPDHVEDMKAGRVVVSEPAAGGSCIWYYEDGLLKNQVAPTMSLQVIGPPSTGSKVVLWAESRLPRQTWSINKSGHICSQMFEGRILDVKGGRGYDRDHVVLWELAKDRASQIWTIHVL